MIKFAVQFIKMRKRILFTIIAPVVVVLLASWGYVGHNIISYNISLSFNEDMEMFNSWVDYLSEHASDADKRKKNDPEEGPKHYIDIDNYPEFVSEGRIPQTLDSCISIYGSKFVDDNGYLPWATLAMYDSVVQCLVREDIENAKKYAADLGHYVADGHMPLHITANYNGQLTGNDGIHYRYESDMIGEFSSAIIYEGMPVEEIEDIRSYVFNYIYKNYEYVDSIIIADDYANSLKKVINSNTYLDALWEKTENMTIEMFKQASHSIAELLYNAMLEAEEIVASQQSSTTDLYRSDFQIKAIPNPASNSVAFHFINDYFDSVRAGIFDSSGKLVTDLPVHLQNSENFSLNWDASNCPTGTYFFVLQNNLYIESCKVLIAR